MDASADYDPFARVYNLHWGSFAGLVIPILEHLVLRHLPDHASVLDLCCGTGQLAARLTGDGYEVTGVDVSGSMIEIAKATAPGAHFHVHDVRQPLPVKGFAAAFSTFDSLNHMMTLEDLTRAFQNVRNVLGTNAYFAFDLNMAAAYEARWRGTFAYVEDDHVCAVRSSHDLATRTGRMDLTIFELARGAWTRADLSLVQRWYAEDEVLAALRAAGFSDSRSFPADEPIAEGCPALPGRMFFVARPPR
ncbi:MAG: class I SAM-dependent methyltransferase [Gammaproteobacteria bacterium]|nr:class I SAM-dependent methyltransferase [Gammaproteobacteria bacterium]